MIKKIKETVKPAEGFWITVRDVDPEMCHFEGGSVNLGNEGPTFFGCENESDGSIEITKFLYTMLKKMKKDQEKYPFRIYRVFVHHHSQLNYRDDDRGMEFLRE